MRRAGCGTRKTNQQDPPERRVETMGREGEGVALPFDGSECCDKFLGVCPSADHLFPI